MILIYLIILWFGSGFIIGLIVLLFSILNQGHQFFLKRDLKILLQASKLGFISVYQALKILYQEFKR